MTSLKPPRYAPGEFFILRSPFLPFSIAEGLLAALGSEPDGTIPALAQELLERPQIMEALYIAAPEFSSLLDQLHTSAPATAPGSARVLDATLRYLFRMSFRATPFGMFAGTSLGRIGDDTRLDISPSLQRHARLDSQVIHELCRAMLADSELALCLPVSRNTTLYSAAGEWRYVESHPNDTDEFKFSLGAVQQSRWIDLMLEEAQVETSPRRLVSLLQQHSHDREDAEAFVTSLIEQQLLVSSLLPSVVGNDPLSRVRDLANRHAPTSAWKPRLERIAASLSRLNTGEAQISLDRYDELKRSVLETGITLERPNLLQVDTYRSGGSATLSRQTTDSLQDAAVALMILSGGAPAPDQVAEEFDRRFAEQDVPLLRVVDPVDGLDAFRDHRGSLPAASNLAKLKPRHRHVTPAQELLLQRLAAAACEGQQEIVITDDDLAPIGDGSRIPESFSVLATLFGAGSGVTAHLKLVAGSSPTAMFGRFLHGNEDIRRSVEHLAAAEQGRHPEIAFAELNFRTGRRSPNVSWRPPLYRYEIPIVGPRDSTNGTSLDLGDLYVRLEGDRLILWSRRLQKRVVPRHSTMQAVRPERDLPLFSFLAGLQADVQFTDANEQTLWGALYQLPWLPRVRYGSTILSRESWVIELRELRSPPARQLEALQVLVEKRGLPDRVVLTDMDHELPLNLRTPWALRSILRVLRAGRSARLQECLSSQLPAVARGESGAFANEVVIPYHREPEASRSQSQVSTADFAAPHVAAGQDFAPGSEWLYLKVYTPPATMNGLLLESIGPVCRALVEEGAAEKWFFLRYTDSGDHLRVRVHCVGAEKWSEAYGRIAGVLTTACHRGDVRLEIGTYQPEVRRYGGRDALRETEQIFHMDSELVLAHLGEDRAETGSTMWFEAATALLHQYLVALGAIEPEEQGAIVERALRLTSQAWSAESSRTALAAANEVHRETRTGLGQRLTSAAAADLPAGEWLEALPPCARAARRALARARTVTPEDWAISLLHMHCNRRFDDHPREHEYLAYALLSRQYAARRGRHMTAPRAPAEAEC